MEKLTKNSDTIYRTRTLSSDDEESEISLSVDLDPEEKAMLMKI